MGAQISGGRRAEILRKDEEQESRELKEVMEGRGVLGIDVFLCVTR